MIGPIPQDQAYHRFADSRAFLGVHNFADVASSLAFVLVGIAGVFLLWRGGAARFSSPDEWRAYGWFFCAVALTGLGSAYYHLAPGATLLIVLAIAGAASVLYWRAFDDLRPYVLVQFGSLAAIVVLCAWLPSRYSHGWIIFAVAALYVLAKLCELRDPAIYQFTRGSLSGHTLKHLISAAAIAGLLWWLAFRQPTNWGSGP